MYQLVSLGNDTKQEESFIFEVSLEVRENANPTALSTTNAEKGVGVKHSPDNRYFDVVPRQKGIFKLRSNVEKKVVVNVHQVNPQENSCRLSVERCFGMLVSPGQNVRHADMQLLEHVTMATTKMNSSDSSVTNSLNDQGEGNVCHIITGSWDPRESAFAVLNKETPGDIPSVFITIAADLIISQVSYELKALLENILKCNIYPK